VRTYRAAAEEINMFANPTTWMTLLGDVALTMPAAPISGIAAMAAIALLLALGAGLLVADARREAKAAASHQASPGRRRLHLVPA
jgi:hypothetical protein